MSKVIKFESLRLTPFLDLMYLLTWLMEGMSRFKKLYCFKIVISVKKKVKKMQIFWEKNSSKSFEKKNPLLGYTFFLTFWHFLWLLLQKPKKSAIGLQYLTINTIFQHFLLKKTNYCKNFNFGTVFHKSSRHTLKIARKK